MMAVQHWTTEEFETAMQQSGVVMVDFWATWCGPCRMLGPTVEKVAETYAGKATVAKVDVDKSETLSVRFGIMSVPTVIFFKDGKEMERKVGVQTQAALASAIEKLL